MAPVTTLEAHGCFGGVQGFHAHDSRAVGLPMRFGVYLPPQAQAGPVPVLYCLAGLTCSEQTFAIKAGAQQHAARHGLALVTPDTSPRDTGVAGADADWDFGTGAGFYLDATREPYARHWRMESWLLDELPQVLAAAFPLRTDVAGVLGHSMGGYGALTLALRHPGVFRSVSALAPICAPAEVPWGRKAFAGYLGEDASAWAGHDAVQLLAGGARAPGPLLVDQGLDDPFLASQLQPERLEQACAAAGQPLTLRRHAGYDHGYFFIASVIGDHLAHHAAALAG
ncbi:MULTISPECIES: S-formylglutathione hydrolase [Ramlibacter]|uniref:S-formylglutathione hydrolase n=1 Tax=Ramlibacter pinisoli TaxID=2682844 RepID=A0A6N8IQ75_9BURK|nr:MULTISPECIES: S-formylglutathione hydrolase [Ramlibacter]MBA2964032.1 S-formylglutathione hydrolase [Ramlibacter sp. CGMCC 1.13660]MVQ28998.1 S-formylglutathione hydrolase [Ramlibacter pinisoli]